MQALPLISANSVKNKETSVSVFFVRNLLRFPFCFAKKQNFAIVHYFCFVSRGEGLEHRRERGRGRERGRDEEERMTGLVREEE